MTGSTSPDDAYEASYGKARYSEPVASAHVEEALSGAFYRFRGWTLEEAMEETEHVLGSALGDAFVIGYQRADKEVEDWPRQYHAEPVAPGKIPKESNLLPCGCDPAAEMWQAGCQLVHAVEDRG